MVSLSDTDCRKKERPLPGSVDFQCYLSAGQLYYAGWGEFFDFGYPSRFGNVIDIAGTNVTSIKAINMAR